MADHGHHAGDIPQMDYAEHERTYKGFVHFAEVGTGVGIASKSLGWKAPMVPFVLLMLALVLLPAAH